MGFVFLVDRVETWRKYGDSKEEGEEGNNRKELSDLEESAFLLFESGFDMREKCGLLEKNIFIKW